jgi:hypothetical protein
MTINIPIETYRRYLKAVQILEKIILSKHTGILASDLEAAEKIISELK